MRLHLNSAGREAGPCCGSFAPLARCHGQLPFASPRQWQRQGSHRQPWQPHTTSAIAVARQGKSPTSEPAQLRPSTSQREGEDDILLEFIDVHKSFGSKSILRGATFKIRRGEAVGIIGSSGTGKSTTLRLAAGLLAPDKGQVLIKGHARQGLLSDDDTSDQLKVGLVFQSGALFDSLTVGENVGFLLHEHTKLPKDKVEALVAESLGKVGLSGVERLYPAELSGGMKKRVALARAIVRDEQHDDVEQLLMYDEPTAGLDPVASTVVEDLIRSMHHPDCFKPQQPGAAAAAPRAAASSATAAAAGNGNGSRAAAVAVAAPATRQPPPPLPSGGASGEGGGVSSYIVVTHQHSTIRRAVDRIIFLHEGRVVWEGSVEEFDTTDEPIVRQFASGSLDGPIVYL